MANIMGTMFTNGEVNPGKIIYNDVDMGLSLDNIELERVVQKKEIMAAQFGTVPYDIIDTGVYWRVRTSLIYATLTLQALINTGMTVSGAGTAAKHGDQNYKSYYSNFARTLILKLVDSDGVVSTDPKYWFTFFKAIPVHASEVQTAGPEDQRKIDVEWHCFKDRTELIYGYNGAASSNGL